MVYPENGKMKEMRQKAFNLSCEDDIGSVLQKSVDLLRELTKVQADPEKLSIATSFLQQERILVEESDINRELPLRNFAYTISTAIETTTEWICGREKTRASLIKQQQQSKGSSITYRNEHDRKVEEDSEESESDIVKMKENWPARSKKNISRGNTKSQKRYPKKQVTCEICNKHFKGSGCLKEHMRVHEMDEDARKPYKCDVCGKAYTQGFNLNKHKRSHSNDETVIKPHQCNACTKRFAMPRQLREHERKHLPDGDPRKKGVECKICGKVLSTMDTLRYHRKLHQGNDRKRSKCEICGIECSNNMALKFHMYHHTGNFPFYCELCDKGCENKYKLRKHMETHDKSDESVPRNKLCDLCPRRFARPNELAAHLKQHRDGTLNHSSGEEELDEDIFQCKLCGKKYRERKVLLRHERDAHGLSNMKVDKTVEQSDESADEESENSDIESSECDERNEERTHVGNAI